MNLSARIIRLEDRVHRVPRAAEIDWQPHLEKLTDAQLDRLEVLSLKAGCDQPENADRDVRELLTSLNAAELQELDDLFAVMGVAR